MKQPARITVRCPTCGHHMKVWNGALLRELRQTARLTQRAFGELVGVSSPYISDIERNRRSCPHGILEAYRELAGGRKSSTNS